MAGHFDNVDNQIMHVRASKRPFFIADAQEGPRSGRGLGNVYFVEELQSDVHQRAADAKRRAKKRFGTETSGYSKARSQLDDRDFQGASGEQGIQVKLIDSSEDLRKAEAASFEDKVKAVQRGLLRTEGYTEEFIDEFLQEPPLTVSSPKGWATYPDYPETPQFQSVEVARRLELQEQDN